ncbi:MAG TPA: twin-arginine translocase subunit TatC, partial [Pirellulales bacterium]|nr:twin-arginine translocase subunit TatC [Pirellulales bacterium]
ALGTFYEKKSVSDFEAWAAERAEKKEEVFYTIEEVEQLVKRDHMVLEIRYIHPHQVFSDLKRVEPQALKGVELASQVSPGATTGVPTTNVSRKEGEAEAPKPRAIASVSSLVPVFNWHPVADDPRTNPTTLSAQEAFSIWMKASFVVGVLVSSPWVFFQIWAFVAAGLYPHEKKYVYRFLPMSLGLFLAGAALAYLFVFEPVLNFLFSFNQWLGFDPEPRISEWLSFVLFLPLGFGVSFQLPLVMLFLERIGVFSMQAYLEKWRIAVLVIFVLSAVLTPADPYSIFLMAVPLTILYFGGLLLCRWMPRSAPSEYEYE